MGTKTSNKANIAEIIVAVVAIASLALGIYNLMYIQNLPGSDELISAGNKHFDNGEYTEAVKCFDEALRIHGSDANTWKNKGFALFNLGINNESASIKRDDRPPYSYGKIVIDYYNSTYQCTRISQDYLQMSFESLKEAVYHNPTDPEARLYKGIICLYLSPCPACNPIEDFDETLTLVDNHDLPPFRDIESCAWYGIGVAYQKVMGEEEKAKDAFNKANETK